MSKVNSKKVFSMLGLAARARHVSSGEFMVEKTIKASKAKLVLVADDASDNTKKMFTDMCTFHKVPLYIGFTKEELGHCIGKEMRASVVITETGFAKTIQQHLKSVDNNTEVNK